MTGGARRRRRSACGPGSGAAGLGPCSLPMSSPNKQLCTALLRRLTRPQLCRDGRGHGDLLAVAASGPHLQGDRRCHGHLAGAVALGGHILPKDEARNLHSAGARVALQCGTRQPVGWLAMHVSQRDGATTWADGLDLQVRRKAPCIPQRTALPAGGVTWRKPPDSASSMSPPCSVTSAMR